MVIYIYLAVGSLFLGVIFTFALIAVCAYFGIDIMQNMYLLAVPATLAIGLNILFIELYTRRKKR